MNWTLFFLVAFVITAIVALHLALTLASRPANGQLIYDWRVRADDAERAAARLRALNLRIIQSRCERCQAVALEALDIHEAGDPK